MNFHNAVSITEFLGSAVSTLRNARDLAKESGNAELKKVINELFDAFSEMKERMLAMGDEIANLKSQLAKKAAVTGPHAPFGYFYKNDDAEHPLCPKCYQEKGHEYMLTIEHFNGSVSRACRCGWSAEEVPTEAVSQVRVSRMTRRR